MRKALLVSVVFVACGRGDDGALSPIGDGAEGDGRGGSVHVGGQGDAVPASGAGSAGSAKGSDHEGGSGGGAFDGEGGFESGSNEPIAGQSGGGAVAEAGQSGGGGVPAGGAAAGGAAEEPAVIINGCIDYLDARASAELRVIPWDQSLGHHPHRCQRVRLGQSVTWEGPFGTHPIQPAGGTMPSPIIGDTLSDQTSYEVTFHALGTYGYECGLHASMRGAIRVVE